ncbi:hypothetical protein Mal4_00500 [Maioricimonas rarisocia]|uniref:Uncharacterized protein n=1 Tax=Maioricimonas rarisocia TaxID=2528026 RepID=A0A517YZV4_9PLAN|nr:hypothetical protein [Maioricimonas rarisocia]QDU35768.1 hypothetical protein Mal4_00500 [Maioricimonas rarisocia]
MSEERRSRKLSRSSRGVVAALACGLVTVLAMTTVAFNRPEKQRVDQHGLRDSVADSAEPTAVNGRNQMADVPVPDELNEESNPSRFVSQGLEQLSSPFTEETVLALNAIVARSLAAIRKFDDIRRDSHGGENAAERLRQYAVASKEAKQARSDMEAASSRVRESGEKYNEEILAAMVRFVVKVDDEIREEIESLAARQSEGEPCL